MARHQITKAKERGWAGLANDDLLSRLGLVRLSPTRFLIPDVIAAKSIADPYPFEPVA